MFNLWIQIILLFILTKIDPQPYSLFVTNAPCPWFLFLQHFHSLHFSNECHATYTSFSYCRQLTSHRENFVGKVKIYSQTRKRFKHQGVETGFRKPWPGNGDVGQDVRSIFVPSIFVFANFACLTKIVVCSTTILSPGLLNIYGQTRVQLSPLSGLK